MAAKTLAGLLTDYVRRNPRTSAMVAFNLGLYVAMAATKGLSRSDLAKLPGKLVALVPAMKDLTDLIPLMSSPPPKSAPRRAASRKSKPAGNRTRRKAA
jgi:hypothetical protein